MVTPIDTSTLGPVKVDPDALPLRARLVREAIRKAAGGEDDAVARQAMETVARWASPVTLAYLGRLLK